MYVCVCVYIIFKFDFLILKDKSKFRISEDIVINIRDIELRKQIHVNNFSRLDVLT